MEKTFGAPKTFLICNSRTVGARFPPALCRKPICLLLNSDAPDMRLFLCQIWEAHATHQHGEELF